MSLVDKAKEIVQTVEDKVHEVVSDLTGDRKDRAKEESNPDDSLESIPHYDRHIVPAETAARQHREGENFGHTPHDPTDTKSIHTTDGYTVDNEGLVNNYAIEPEMYVDVPGDLRQQTEQEAEESVHQFHELSEDEKGKLTSEHDLRHKGPGLV
ncbi:hypothetical protein TUMEXPCC7403_09200 [Tumidithrix helvetica PCC 7403]|uniref:hypothetical protein n=1 Tax=Tumidithrix helvetica TaxID=3457545 RepID=UPI003CC0E6E4